MGDVVKFPKDITGRDGYIVAEALYLAVEAIDQKPEELRRETDKRDMLKILNTIRPDWKTVFEPLEG